VRNKGFDSKKMREERKERKYKEESPKGKKH